MPRKGRGGKRQGKPGTAYGQRVDLNGGSAAPAGADIRPYGGGESLPDVPTATSGPAGGGGGPQGATVPRPVSVPGSFALDADSAFEDEPLTAGMGIGAGPGPEALGSLAPNAPTDDMVNLVAYLPALEHMQMSPHISRKMRNLIRMLRASVPPEARMAAAPPPPTAPEE